MELGFSGFGVSVKGKDKKLNQDSFIFQECKDFILLVVCDGLGSKRLSNIGAKSLVQSVVLILNEMKLSKNLLSDFESKLKHVWHNKIRFYTQDFEECASTLLCGVIYDDLSYFGRIGDGIIAIFGNKDYCLEEENKDFANFTHSFGDMAIAWQILNTKDLQSVAICSDGISEFLDRDKIMDFFKAYISEYKNIDQNKLQEIKTWLRDFNAKGFKDDKTLVVAHRN